MSVGVKGIPRRRALPVGRVRKYLERVAVRPEHPETLHFTGDGVFMIAGRIIDRRSEFPPGMLP